MTCFIEIAEALLKEGAFFRKSYLFHNGRIEQYKDNYNLTDQIDFGAPIGNFVGASTLPIFGFILGNICAPALSSNISLAPNFDLQDKLISDIKQNSKRKYSIKEVSNITGIEDWRLRRFILNGKLKANSNNSASKNPGKAGYSVEKSDLIQFLQEQAHLIGVSQTLRTKLKQYAQEQVSSIDFFLEQIKSVYKLGELEVQLDEFNSENNQPVDDALLKKKILLQKLIIEKNFFESQKYLFIKWISDSLTE